MDIIIQPKRILLPEFYDENSQKRFNRYVTIQSTNMYLQVTNEWVAAYEVIYNNEPYLAVPRNFKIDVIKKNIAYDSIIKDLRKDLGDSRNINTNVKCRDSDQELIVNFLTGENDFNNIKNKSRKALFAKTGKGKTFCSLKSISIKNYFAFINCPDEKAIKTWKDEILKFTDIQENEIGYLKGSDSIPKLIKNKNKYKIVLGSAKTFSRLIIDNKYNIIEEFFKEMKFSLLIHDEVHMNLMVVFFLEMISNPDMTYYLTATPHRRVYKEDKLLESLMPSENCILEEELEPRFDFYRCNYYSNPTSGEHTKGLNPPGGFNFIAYGKNMIFNPKLQYMKEFESHLYKIVRYAIKKVKEGNKIAVIAKTKEENTIIAEMIKKRFPSKSIGVFNSTIEDMEERFKETDCDIIISTNKSFDGIINIPKLEAIILIYPISSDAHLLQVCGRIREEEGKGSYIFMMVDNSFKRLKKAMVRVKSIIGPECKSFNVINLNENKNSLDAEID